MMHNQAVEDQIGSHEPCTGKVYLAGPMRGYPDFNFPAFHAAARTLRSYGYTVFSPAEKDIEKHGDTFKSVDGNEDILKNGFNLRDALAMDLEWICKNADAIALLPGWEKSKGASAEKATAMALGLEIIYV
jgi:hypothetical protein